MAPVESFNITDQSNKDLRNKLKEEEQARRSADSALKGAQKQAEDQRLLLRDAKEQLTSSKEQIVAIRKKLEEVQKLKGQAERSKDEAEKARDKAEQHGYDVGVAETEETLRAEVLAMCRTYWALTWGGALNRAGVEASSELRKPKNIYYPPAIRASDLPPTQGEAAFTVADPIEETQPQDPPPPNQQKQAKESEAPKEISSNVDRPSDKTTEVP